MADRGDSVDIMLGLPSDTADHDLNISGGADALQIVLHGQSQPLLEVLQLYSTIDPEQTRHSVEDGRLTVTLHKRDPSLAWPSLHAVREEQQDQQVVCISCCAGLHMLALRIMPSIRSNGSANPNVLCGAKVSWVGRLTSANQVRTRAVSCACRQLLRRRVPAQHWRSADGCGTC
jgi:hypothetical protein